MATTITIIKPGTGLNVLVPSEPLLVTLALAGLTGRCARRCGPVPPWRPGCSGR